MQRNAAGALLIGCAVFLAADQPAPKSADDLFQTSRVWNVDLKFTAEDWAAMEPTGGPGPGGPGFAGRPGPGGPRMSPAAMLMPAFMAGDQDHDGTLSVNEFDQVASGWFARWSAGGTLDAAKLRAGLQSTFPPPQFGPPGPPGGMLGREGRGNGMSAAMGIEFPYVRANLEFEGAKIDGVAARYKGNSTFMASRNSIKRSIKIDLNRFEKSNQLAGQTTLNLHNNVMDASWMNEGLGYRLFRDAGVPASRSSYARVYVTVPGKYDRQYLGLYSIVEEVDKIFAKSRFGSSKGAIFKPSTRELFNDLGPDWAKYEQIYDPKTSLTREQKARLIEFSGLVTKAGDEEFAAKVASYLDVDEFARFMAATVLISNMDSILQMGQNFYVHLHPETNRFQFLPWDLDHSFGQLPMAGSNLEALSIDRPWQGRNRFLERVFNIEAFRKLYREHLAEFNTKLLAPERIAAQVDELAKTLRAAVAEESPEKLARFDKVAAGEPAPMNFGPGPGPGGPRGFPGGGAMKPIRAFAGPRHQSVEEQLAGKPAPPQEARGFGRGPGRFSPAMFLEPGLMSALDNDKNGEVSRTEFQQGFSKWFAAWNSDATGKLTSDQLRAGIERDLMPPMPPLGPRR